MVLPEQLAFEVRQDHANFPQHQSFWLLLTDIWNIPFGKFSVLFDQVLYVRYDGKPMTVQLISAIVGTSLIPR